MSLIETLDPTTGKPTTIPKSDATTAYDLLTDVITCIEHEPRRLEMGHWVMTGDKLQAWLDDDNGVRADSSEYQGLVQGTGRTATLLWFAPATVPCTDCGRPTRARHFRICARCLRERWRDGENWPFAGEWKPAEAGTDDSRNRFRKPQDARPSDTRSRVGPDGERGKERR